MKFSYRKLLAILLVATMTVGLFAACGPNDTDVPLEEIYTLNVTTKEISVGVTDSLMVLDSSDGERTYTTTWTSSDPSIVHVDSLGILTGISAGTATVTATVAFDGTDKTLALNCTVTVKDTTVALKGISFITESSTYTAANQIVDLAIVFDPVNATNKNYVVTSSNPAVVSVQGNIAMTVGEGTAVLTAVAEDGGFVATHTVTVVFPKNDYESIKLNRTSRTLTVGNTTTLTVTVSPKFEGVDPVVTWTSSDPSVATVDSNGKVKAIAAGTATITVTVSDNVTPHTATCKITVNKASSEETVVKATGVKLDKDRIEVNKSTTETIKFEATVTPSNATQTGTWKSDNTSVATVDSKTGVITINKSIDPSTAAGGMMAVKITYTVGSVSASGTLIIYPDGIDVSGGGNTGDNVLPTGLTLNYTSLNVAVGGTAGLMATFSPATTTNKAVTWSSSDTSVAVVVNGVVTGLKEGKATITAKSNADSKIKATCNVTVGSSSGTVTGSVISLSQSTLNLIAGTTSYALTATLATGTTGTVTWMSSNPAVATVDQTGKVTPLAAGTTIITAAINGSIATCTVTVTAAVVDTDVKATLQLTLSGSSFSSGDELRKGSVLTATIVFDSVIPEADKATFTYALNSPESTVIGITELTKGSYIIEGKQDGMARLILTVNDWTGKYKINCEEIVYIIVSDPSFAGSITSAAGGITFASNNAKLNIGGKKDLVATLTKASTTQTSTDDDIIWTSSDTKVAIVARQGNKSGFTVTNTITAVGEGTCFITATLRSDSTKTATFRVVVESTSSVNGDRIYLSPGASYTIAPSDTTAYSAQFTYYPASVATWAIENRDATTGMVKSVTITVPATVKSINAVVMVNAYTANGVKQESFNIIVEEPEEIEMTVKSTTNITMYVGDSKSLTVGQTYYSYVGETPIWYINTNGNVSTEGALTISGSMGTSVTAKALTVGTVQVYCEYGTYRDVYNITIKSPTSSATNFSLSTTPPDATIVNGGTIMLTFYSNVPTSGTVYWMADSTEFHFQSPSTIITNSQFAQNSVTFNDLTGTVPTRETHTITAVFTPTDGGPQITKTITVYIQPSVS